MALSKKANLKSGGVIGSGSAPRPKRPPGVSVGASGKAGSTSASLPVSQARSANKPPAATVTRAGGSATGARSANKPSAATVTRARAAKVVTPSAASNRASVLTTTKTQSSKHAGPEGPSTRSVSSPVAHAAFERLRAAYPDAHCELDHQGPFQLLVATVLSAQSTDVAVNRITPALFKRWASARELAQAPLADVENAISSLGMFRQKARHLVGLSKALVEQHRGEVPHTLDALVALPGVGRKTANVVLGVAFGAPEGVVVDTHVQRLAQRLGWTTDDQPGPIEQDLMQLFPRDQWDRLSHTLIFHGRRCCTARAPACAACPVNDSCPSAFAAEAVGRKNRPAR